MKFILLALSNVYCMTTLSSKTHLENGPWVIKLLQYSISQIRGEKKHCKDLLTKISKRCSKPGRVFLILYPKSFEN